MKPLTAEKARIVLQLLLGLLLLWAAVSKLANPTDFLASIYAYETPFPRPLLKFVAVFLPWMELICGLLLLVGFAPEATLLCVTALFVVFVLATAQAWVRGLSISCGCFDLTIFGLGKRFPALITFIESVGFAFFRNLFLTAAAVYLLRNRLAALIPEETIAPVNAPRVIPQPKGKHEKRTAVSK